MAYIIINFGRYKMKKLLTVMLVLVMAFAFASCGGGSEGESEGDSGSKSRLAGVFGGIGEESGIHMNYEMEIDGKTTVTDTYMKDGKIYTETDMEGSGKSITIYTDGYMYTLVPETKTGYKMKVDEDTAETLDTSSVLDSYEEYTDDVDFEKGEKEVDGKTYYSETYTTGENSAIYCFDGDKLVYMISETSDGEETIIKYNAIDGDVDDSIFEVPDGYTITEM